MVALAKFLRRLADRLDPVAPRRATININGNLDPVAVGREIERVHGKLTGR